MNQNKTLRILLGGSPCTHWAICQHNNRETKPEGVGWELFRNYLIAKEKFKPDFFLYENNESASQAIKDQIAEELGYPLVHIDSALVSAQRRRRIYCCNWDVPQPEDRGILLKDILETGIVDREKVYCLKHQAGNARDYIKKHHAQVAFQPVCVAQRGRYDENGKIVQHFEPRLDGKTNTITTVTKDNLVAEPVRIGDIGSTAQANRVYSPYGKSVNLVANGGGAGAKTGLYATPINITNDSFKHLTDGEMDYMLRSTRGGRNHFDFGYIQEGKKDKGKCLVSNVCKGVPYNVVAQEVEVIDLSKYKSVDVDSTGNIIVDGKTIYLVFNGEIGYGGNLYPIKLLDGYYIIRKLTVKECERLQTMPEGYVDGVISDTQAYKCLGNGWTAEVIIHILEQALKDVPRDTPLEVLSMYDGIATGLYCLKKMGFTNIKYYASEVDKYAIKAALHNHPEIIEIGDAFQVRDEDWSIEKYVL